MKIVSKQISTTIINDDDGSHCETVQKTVTVTSNSFESLEIDAMHAIIATALQKATVAELYDPITGMKN